MKQQDSTRRMQENLMMQANLALAALPFMVVHLLHVLRRINSDTTGDSLHPIRARLRLQAMSCLLAVAVCPVTSLCAQSRTFHITQRYLNIPVERASEMGLFQISVGGVLKREFPVQLAEHAIDYWIFLDVSEFKGSTITLTGSNGVASPSVRPLWAAFIKRTRSRARPPYTRRAIGRSFTLPSNVAGAMTSTAPSFTRVSIISSGRPSPSESSGTPVSCTGATLSVRT